jgi:hypothetical protein
MSGNLHRSVTPGDVGKVGRWPLESSSGCGFPDFLKQGNPAHVDILDVRTTAEMRPRLFRMIEGRPPARRLASIDRLTRLAGMNVRVFVLIGMTALFGLLWSSDRHYQQTQAIARVEQERARNLVAISSETSGIDPSVLGYTDSIAETSLVVRPLGRHLERTIVPIATPERPLPANVAKFFEWGHRLGSWIESETRRIERPVDRGESFANGLLRRLISSAKSTTAAVPRDRQ